MTTHARGTFEVKVSPQAPADRAEGATLGRMSIDKQFHGDLEATSKGEMLTAATGVKGSAGYVASGSAEHCMAAAAPLYSSTLAP